MSKVEAISDPDFVRHQYGTASNLSARIRLHQEFSTNKYGWQRWLFDQFKLPPRSRVLELGCGTGNLWLENLDRVPSEADITVSDVSAGILEEARQNLRNSPAPIHFEVIDAQSIPYDAASFDAVIANHMLYHVPDREKALSEITRVLKPRGRFYSSTIGRHHLEELGDLIARFDTALSSWGEFAADTFNLEDGAAELGRYFSSVTLARYTDSLVVTDAKLLTDYVLSGRLELSAEQRGSFAEYVGHALTQNGGTFFVTKDSGVFEAEGPASL